MECCVRVYVYACRLFCVYTHTSNTEICMHKWVYTYMHDFTLFFTLISGFLCFDSAKRLSPARTNHHSPFCGSRGENCGLYSITDDYKKSSHSTRNLWNNGLLQSFRNSQKDFCVYMFFECSCHLSMYARRKILAICHAIVLFELRSGMQSLKQAFVVSPPHPPSGNSSQQYWNTRTVKPVFLLLLHFPCWIVTLLELGDMPADFLLNGSEIVVLFLPVAVQKMPLPPPLRVLGWVRWDLEAGSAPFSWLLGNRFLHNLIFSSMVGLQCFKRQVSWQPVILMLTGTFCNWSIFGRKKENRSTFCLFWLGSAFSSTIGKGMKGTEECIYVFVCVWNMNLNFYWWDIHCGNLQMFPIVPYQLMEESVCRWC